MLKRSLASSLMPTSNRGPAASSVSRRVRRLAPLAILLVITLLLLRSESNRHLYLPLPHPFAVPGRLVYTPSSPFATSFRPTRKERPSPRLMEKLMVKLRGGEREVEDAVGKAVEERRRRRAGERDGRREVDAEADVEEEEDDLSWLRKRTVLLMGDSIDRYHLLHLCQFLKPNSPLMPLPWPHAVNSDFVSIISPSTTPNIYPPPLMTLEDNLSKSLRDGRPYGSEHSRPWVCKIDQGGLDAWLVWIFWNGLDDGASTPGVVKFNSTSPSASEGGEAGRPAFGTSAKKQPFGDRAFYPIESEHFHPPLGPEDRMLQIALPILKKLGRKVDLVELGIGAWDLGMFRSLDKLSVEEHIASNPSTLSSDDLPRLASALSDSSLSPHRLAWFRRRLTSVLDLVTTTFPPRRSFFSGDPAGPPRVSVRTMPVPPQSFEWPWVMSERRVLQIEGVTRELVKGYGGGKVFFNEWAKVLRDSTEFLDHIHPSPVPGSWLWADMMLYELRRIVTGRS